MNINKQSARLFNELVGKVPTEVLYREVFGMTPEEAGKAAGKLYNERIAHSSQVEAVYIQKARNNARRACGFREKNDEVKPMPVSGIAHLMGFAGPPQEPEAEEEEL
jgi:hypothetical protein